ncbi:hypothetical protein [Seonamhaeicola sp.]|uniref:hypothetical protein n=1 Tax=Seonamhaeicola sp. TaxID=1912245 RepID=UPI002636DAC1|nr:hypothetical protein [Seonamhaeicola sp.]
MVSVKDSSFYTEVLKELNYPFATAFIFKGFVVVEINEGIEYTWDNHGKLMAQDVAYFLGTDGGNLIYISNRMHSYSVVPQDWLKFFRSDYRLKEYYVVSPNRKGTFNLIIESLFFKNKIKSFPSLSEAVVSAKNSTLKEEVNN